MPIDIVVLVVLAAFLFTQSALTAIAIWRDSSQRIGKNVSILFLTENAVLLLIILGMYLSKSFRMLILSSEMFAISVGTGLGIGLASLLAALVLLTRKERGAKQLEKDWGKMLSEKDEELEKDLKEILSRLPPAQSVP